MPLPKHNHYSKELALAQRACLAAGKIAMKYFRGKFTMRLKAPRNIVTQADVECEQAVKRIISNAFPSHSFIGEEEGAQGRTGEVWHIDPIDGTTNFAHGLEYFCTSIGFVKNGWVVCGAVYQPALKKMFYASKGGGAFLNGKKIHVSAVSRLEDALLISGFPYDNSRLEEKTFASMKSLVGKCHDIRRFGSAALDFCAVAEGSCEAFFEYSLHSWDVAAGLLIVEEAGGAVTDINGVKATVGSGHFLASNRLLHRQVLERIERV